MRTINCRVMVALAAAFMLLASRAYAGGPLIINPDTKTPYAFGPGPVPVYYDQGNFAVVNDWSTDPPGQVVFENAVGRHVVEKGYGDWSSVPTTSFRAVVMGDFSQVGLADINGDNVADVIGKFNGGGVYVIFDADGSIMENFFGVNPYSILGISSPEFGEDGTSIITESWTVLNGQAVDAYDTDARQYQGVATHEFGHSIGLAHTQTNGAAYFYSDSGETVGPKSCGTLPYSSALTVADVETMYPYSRPVPDTGSGIAQANIHTLDDISAISDLYPGPGWPDMYGTITGKILDLDGRTPLTGVNVIARNLSDPFSDATSTMSGEWTQDLFGPDGTFTIHGLKPGARYALYVDAILAGGFPTEPLWYLPGPEKFYNGPSRGQGEGDGASGGGGQKGPVSPCRFQAIAARQGEVVKASIKFDHVKGTPVLFSLGYGAGASGVSGDGRTVVGNYGRGGPVFRWTEKTGIQPMDVASSGEETFISRNGDYISTNLIDNADNDLGAFRWDATGGWRPVSPVGYCGPDATYTHGVTDDGSVYGLAYNSCDDFKTFRWNPETGTVLLPSAMKKADGTGANGRPNKISADGSTLVGWEETQEGYRLGVVWVNGTPSVIENEIGQQTGEALSTSGDGQVISGMVFDWALPDQPTPHVGAGWRRAIDSSSLEYYGPLSEDASPAKAYAMSFDGSVMAGMSGDPWFSIFPAPFLWTKEMGTANLDEFVRLQGTSMEQYASLWTPMAMSSDGSVIVGWGVGFLGPNGWVLQIPKAFICHDPPGRHKKGQTMSVSFPKEFDQHLAEGDTVGPCADYSGYSD